MKTLRLCSVLLAGLFLTTVAKATDRHHSYDGACYLEGDVSGTSISIGIGAQVLKGPGLITCLDGNGFVTQRLAVEVKFSSFGIGLEFRHVRSMRVRSAPVSLRHGVAGLLGTYSIGATTGVTLIAGGIDFDAALACVGNGLNLELALYGTDAIGLGARLHAGSLRIASAGEVEYVDQGIDGKVLPPDQELPIQDELPVQDPVPPIQNPDVQQ